MKSGQTLPPPDDWERVQIALSYLNRAHQAYMDQEYLPSVRAIDSCLRALGPLATQPKASIWHELGINLPEEATRLAHSIRQRTQRKPVLKPVEEGPPWAWDSFSHKEQAYLKFYQHLYQKGILSEF